ncbi:hypothetical protein ACFL5D_04690 [Candidatus Neomarinimicrobiota bacterium]
MKHLKSFIMSILLILTMVSSLSANDIWKISLYNGNSLSCEQLSGIENDSLYTMILGESQSFAIDDISNMTKYNKNVNYRLIGGSLAGGLLGVLVNQIAGSNNNRNNQSGSVLIGAFTGATVLQYLSNNGSINFSKMTNGEKNNILEGLVINSK